MPGCAAGDLPVVVVDNASADGTLELVRATLGVMLIANRGKPWICGAR